MESSIEPIENRIDFLSFLKTTFMERCRKNPKYSLRSYARSLDIQPAPLSEILRNKRPISENVKIKLGLALKLKASDLHLYTINKTKTKNPKPALQHLDDVTFSMLSDWYYFAILELFELEHFDNDPKWMAKMLNLSVPQVNLALENLVHCGFLNKNGKTFQLTRQVFTSQLVKKKTSLANQSHQIQLLDLSAKAVIDQPLEVRDHSSMLFSVNREDLAQARQIISKFRKDLSELFNNNLTKNDVYQLQVSLFPLTNDYKKGIDHEN